MLREPFSGFGVLVVHLEFCKFQLGEAIMTIFILSHRLVMDRPMCDCEGMLLETSEKEVQQAA